MPLNTRCWEHRTINTGWESGGKRFLRRGREYGAGDTGLDLEQPSVLAEKVRNLWKWGIRGPKKFASRVRNNLPRERQLRRGWEGS